ncbi:hypothetical protein [Paraburkholderia sp. BL21I4N1]|uniref:hypothetical protein n=1 Tax=Paraburkholderia sp. BL21I4N1 TaxID=1938801 RepID=UPI000D4598CF|nr:hypothetical protein [Paraburkholderia sp. BL21I4N1]PQV53428.1 hypothetical protein B0G83_102514 [Paraburkholderia sp. BL21I4N1]
MASKLTQAVQDAILASVELNDIETFDDGHDPEVYSTNVYVDVTIDGTTYTVVHERGTDGEVERAPDDGCGIVDVYVAVMKLTGEYNDEEADDVLDIFEHKSEDHDLSTEAFNMGLAIDQKIAQVAEAEQADYDTKRAAELVITPEFGVDANGNVVGLDSERAVLQFEHGSEKYGNMIRFIVSEKNDDGLWKDAGEYHCFHFHLEPQEVYRRYAERQAFREAERAEREAYESGEIYA